MKIDISLILKEHHVMVDSLVCFLTQNNLKVQPKIPEKNSLNSSSLTSCGRLPTNNWWLSGICDGRGRLPSSGPSIGLRPPVGRPLSRSLSRSRSLSLLGSRWGRGSVLPLGATPGALTEAEEGSACFWMGTGCDYRKQKHFSITSRQEKIGVTWSAVH